MKFSTISFPLSFLPFLSFLPLSFLPPLLFSFFLFFSFSFFFFIPRLYRDAQVKQSLVHYLTSQCVGHPSFTEHPAVPLVVAILGQDNPHALAQYRSENPPLKTSFLLLISYCSDTQQPMHILRAVFSHTHIPSQDSINIHQLVRSAVRDFSSVQLFYLADR